MIGSDPATAPAIASAVEVASLPMAFTQHQPLMTDAFIREAERRCAGVRFDTTVLRELYKYRLLVPFVRIVDRRVTTPIPPPSVDAGLGRTTRTAFEGLGQGELGYGGTSLMELRKARDSGRLQDLLSQPFKPWIYFDRPARAGRRWWNGFLYSKHQLTALAFLKQFLVSGKQHIRRKNESYRIYTTFLKPEDYFVQQMERVGRIALVAAALEARYLPCIKPGQLVNIAADEWYDYRRACDPRALGSYLHYSATQAREDAELLLSLAHSIDPVGNSWSRLVQRAPRDKWKGLKDSALLSMDLRETAEILLLFYEDLVQHGDADELPDVQSTRAWHPQLERLGHRPETLGEMLMGLGISPFPLVVLAVEGDSEEIHAPLVWRTLGFGDYAEWIRLHKLGGADHDPVKIGGLSAAPLIARKDENGQFWWVSKPPTCFMIAVDPEGRYYGTAEKVEKTRRAILSEVKSVIAAQDASAEVREEELEPLVKIHLWDEVSYELAHFTDEELADGIMAIHRTIGGLTRANLISAIAAERNRPRDQSRPKDIKAVWSRWDYKPSKVDLARVLWPVLEHKLMRALSDASAPIPPIMGVMQDAYVTAANWQYRSFALRIKQSTDEA